jgi:tRNA 2-thiouridine synthesizing protein A
VNADDHSPPPTNEVIHIIDGGDLACARLLIHLRNLIQHLEPGALVHLEASDPVAPIDLPAWCRMTGHTYLGKVDGLFKRPRYAIRAAESPLATRPDAPWRTMGTDNR